MDEFDLVDRTVPTVKINHPELPGEWIIINEADYDPTKMSLYVEPKSSKKSKTDSGSGGSGDDSPATS